MCVFGALTYTAIYIYTTMCVTSTYVYICTHMGIYVYVFALYMYTCGYISSARKALLVKVQGPQNFFMRERVCVRERE